MKRINNCTLVICDCYNYGKAVDSLQKSMAQCEFDKVLFFTDIPLEVDGVEVIQIAGIKSAQEYSVFILTELWRYIETDFVLITQHDGYILNGELFDEKLYDYDYAGAVWPESDGLTVGNGGFSWRSKRLLQSVANDNFIRKSGTVQEDVTICRIYRGYLEETYGLKWATDEICNKFSFELIEPTQVTFGFHGFFHEPLVETVILKRSAAIGDIILLEPVMRWYSLHGYNVVLDIPIQFFDLFSEHYFPVKHISQFNRRIPAKEINLDKSYEVRPGQPYLKSYFEFCGIKDFELSKPFLYPQVSKETKLFNKYAIIHIDKRDQPSRNIFGIEWSKVTEHLESLGFMVLQVGRYKHETVANEINTSGIRFLKFVIGGCDLFIGCDSAPAHIAVAYNKPAIIFCGSVNPKYVYPDLTNVKIMQNDCDRSGCWHLKGSSVGQPCFYDVEKPPCSVHSAESVIEAINKFDI